MPRPRTSSRPLAARAPAWGKPSAAAESVPERPSLRALRNAAADCTACSLHLDATGTVFGEGARRARMMLVGEQPGDQEDLSGHVFVGPAGRLLDRALANAGIPRARLYLTNAVKHFKFERRGKRRVHAKPAYSEVRACRAWLEAELTTIAPEVIVCLGAVAAQAFFGSGYAFSKTRGEPREDTPFAPFWLATWHPSAVLRAPDNEARARMEAELTADLARAWQLCPSRD